MTTHTKTKETDYLPAVIGDELNKIRLERLDRIIELEAERDQLREQLNEITQSDYVANLETRFEEISDQRDELLAACKIVKTEMDALRREKPNMPKSQMQRL